MRGYTDCLRIELDIERCGVSATTVHPGGVRTNIVRNARVQDDLAMSSGRDNATEFDRIARTTPEAAACHILDGVQKNRRRVLVGPDAKMFDLVSRLPAAVSQSVLVLGGRRRLR